MFPSKQDYTRHKWFSEKKVNRKGNLLFEIVPNFGYWRKFGQNTLDRMTFLGKNEYMDKFTGYVLGWDKTHRCDRCGKKLTYKGSHTVKMAYAIKLFPHLKHCGLCQECDHTMELEKEKDKKDGIISIRRYDLLHRKSIPNTYKERYIWL